MANQQMPKGPEPGNRALDDPALVVDAQPAPVFERPIDPAPLVRADEGNPASRHLAAQAVAVVAAVADQAVGQAPPGCQPRAASVWATRLVSAGVAAAAVTAVAVAGTCC